MRVSVGLFSGENEADLTWDSCPGGGAGGEQNFDLGSSLDFTFPVLSFDCFPPFWFGKSPFYNFPLISVISSQVSREFPFPQLLCQKNSH